MRPKNLSKDKGKILRHCVPQYDRLDVILNGAAVKNLTKDIGKTLHFVQSDKGVGKILRHCVPQYDKHFYVILSDSEGSYHRQR